jgi:hypothetical protein
MAAAQFDRRAFERAIEIKSQVNFGYGVGYYSISRGTIVIWKHQMCDVCVIKNSNII